MDELTMNVSGVCTIDGHKAAYVTFSDAERTAEGIIPDCRITKQSGFTEEEVCQLELYMKMNLGMLKKTAAAIDPLRAILRSGGEEAKTTDSAESGQSRNSGGAE